MSLAASRRRPEATSASVVSTTRPDEVGALGCRLVERQRALEVARGFVVTTDADGIAAGLDAGGEGRLEVTGGLGVQRHLTGRGGDVGPRESGQEGRMQSSPLPRKEVFVDRLCQQRVPEGVGVAVRDEHLVVDGFSEGVVEPRCVEADDLGEHGIGGDTATTGHRPDDEAGVVGETVEPHEHEVGEALGEGALGEAGVEQLFGVEGVAGGAADDGGRALVAEPRGLP